MMYVATVQAFDAVGAVHAHLSVRAYDDDPAVSSSIVFACTTTFLGTGETDPTEWARDVLVGLLEDI